MKLLNSLQPCNKLATSFDHTRTPSNRKCFTVEFSNCETFLPWTICSLSGANYRRIKEVPEPFIQPTSENLSSYPMFYLWSFSASFTLDIKVFNRLHPPQLHPSTVFMIFLLVYPYLEIVGIDVLNLLQYVGNFREQWILLFLWISLLPQK